MKVLFGLCLVLGLLTGCVTRPTVIPLTGDPVVDGPVALAKGPARDRVLWEYRMAAAEMRRSRFADAKVNLDDALLTLGGIYGKNADAQKARSLFSEEAKKTFIGEPYERVMANYYRGILYWMDGEPDNARACFRNGEFQDSDAENKTYACDYVLLDYLDGLASAKLGGDGSDAFKRAQTNSHLEAPPAYDKNANVLFFVEMGRGPTKFATGQYQEELRFLPGRSAARKAVIRVGNRQVVAPAYDDLTFQATTRGGRVMDHILGNKVIFKKTTDVVGNAAIVGGAVMGMAGGNRDASLGLVAFGLLSKVVSATTTPAADARCWDNLPQYLGFGALSLPPGEYQADIQFVDAAGRPQGGPRQLPFKVASTSGDTVLFVSDQR